MKDITTSVKVLAACCLFVLLGTILIPYAGVQSDEALFARPLYLQNPRELCISVFHHEIPLMVMSYIGTLKTLLYRPIFALFRPGAFSVRLPMVLAGALTVFVFFHLASRIASPRTALLAAGLLATDPSFLLTNTFDWGPVALEHLLLVTGCFFLVRFGQEPLLSGSRCWSLAAGFFCLGLALWNKAIFLWALAGLVAAGLAVCWPEIRRSADVRLAGLAAAAFIAGAFPFFLYNIRQPNATLATNAGLDFTHFQTKFLQLRLAVDGSVLLGFLPAQDEAGSPKVPTSLPGRAALGIRHYLGEHRANLMPWAFGLALLAIPVWWRSRAARFSLVFLAVTWICMALTRDAGESAHHTVLLWPFPQLFVAATLSSTVRWRWVGLVAGTLLICSNLLVINEYILQFERDGADGSFTDALGALSGALADGPAQTVYITDWGMVDTLTLLHQGRLNLRLASGPYMTDSPSEAERKEIGAMLSDSAGLFVDHVAAREVFAGSRDRLRRAAASAGYRVELVRTVADSNGRAVFEIFRMARARPG